MIPSQGGTGGIEAALLVL